MSAAIRHHSSTNCRILCLRLLGCLALAGIAAATGCSNVEGPDDQSRVPNVTGSWTGTTAFGSNGFTTSMNLQQQGRAVTGDMRIAGAFRDAPLTGEIDELDRFLWSVNRDCEVWSGVMTIDASQISMNGPVQIDASGCQGVPSSSASLRMDRVGAQ